MAETLQIRRWAVGDKDAHGNAANALGEPEDWRVYDIAPGAMLEPGQANRDLSEIAYTVYAPSDGNEPTERDVVVVNDDEYDVEGRPRDWSRGQWGGAGVVVELRRREG